MLTRLQELLVRPRKKPVAGHSHLAVEALESRTVLSATQLAAQAVFGDPLPANALRAAFHAEPATDVVRPGAPPLQGMPRDAGGVVGRDPIETPAPNFVASARFAADASDPRFYDPGDVGRLRIGDPAVETWHSPPHPGHDPGRSFAAAEMPMPGGGNAAEPSPGRDPALPPNGILVIVLPPPMPSASRFSEAPPDRIWEAGLAPLEGSPAWGDSLAPPGSLEDPVSALSTTSQESRSPAVAVRQENGTMVRSGSRQSGIDDQDAVMQFVGLLGDMRSAGLERDDEGGVVELGDLGSAMRRSLLQPALRRDSTTSDTIWEHEDIDLRERLRLRPSLRDEVFDESRLQDILEPQTAEDRAEQGRAERGHADVAKGSPRERGHDEGGTVELAVAAYSTAAWWPADVPPADERALGTNPIRGIGAGSIPMDTGVGLFQAFELAVGPGEPLAQPSEVSLDPGQPPDSPATAASAAAPLDAVAEPAALDSGLTDLPTNRALAVPFVLAIFSLLDSASRSGAQDDPRRNAQPRAVFIKRGSCRHA